MIRLLVDNTPIKIEWVEFSDGALTCKLIDLPQEFNVAWLTVDPSTKVRDVVLECLLVRSALVNNNNKMTYYINLNIPYFPFARADRVFEHGNPLPMDMIGIMVGEFDQVRTVDIHNQEWLPLYLISETPQHKAVFEVIKDLGHYDYVVAPDKGALKKIYELNHPVITATKVRDISTGKITSTELDTNKDLKGCKLLIVDDILDGGGTFIPLAEKLKSLGASVDLYVTHLIGAKGLDLFKGKIDNIYCYHTVGGYLNQQDVLNYNLNN